MRSWSRFEIMGPDFFNRAFPALVRQHFLNSATLSSLLYLIEDNQPKSIAFACLMLLGTIGNGIAAYREYRPDDLPETNEQRIALT